MGYGTEKLEEELKLHFPLAKIQRMDLETTRSKTGYETIIDRFERQETDILVGTQMVTKGLDFDHVSLVGIFNADRMIHFPDFRSLLSRGRIARGEEWRTRAGIGDLPDDRRGARRHVGCHQRIREGQQLPDRAATGRGLGNFK